jgi:uncharacterized protein YkwD
MPDEGQDHSNKGLLPTPKGQGGHPDAPYGGGVTTAPAAARFPLGFVALVAALAALAVSASAHGAAGASSSHLAPAAACAGADDPRASVDAQRAAIVCLVNWARRKDGRVPLSAPSPIVRAAAIKGRVVASCKEFSHTPCGKDMTSAIRASGYAYGWFGENLFVGVWGQVSARDVVAAWLGSAPHRANLLRPAFQHLGAARVRVSGLFGEGDVAVWVATFASPR